MSSEHIIKGIHHQIDLCRNSLRRIESNSGEIYVKCNSLDSSINFNVSSAIVADISKYAQDRFRGEVYKKIDELNEMMNKEYAKL